MNNLNDKILGSLIGGAVGDALGYPVEFIYSYKGIERKYGEGGIRDYDTNPRWMKEGKAQFSDDTQMTLYTAEGLLHAVEHNSQILPTIAFAYVHWYCGQSGTRVAGLYPSQLAGIAELNQNRAPGNTCMSAMRAFYECFPVRNDSMGCGGIMRIAPIALYGAAHGWTLAQTAKLAGDAAEITHKHKMSTISSACCAAIIQLCALEEAPIDKEGFVAIVDKALQCVEEVYKGYAYMENFRNRIEYSLEAAERKEEDWYIIESSLGEGWVAPETLAIAVFSVARHLDSFEECVVSAVNHGGDSDSTGAVAGNIIGAILGYKAIPAKYTDNIQLRELIEEFAGKLA